MEGGIKLQDLIDDAARHGLAMSNLGSITWQSIAGALSTGTHGTGIKLGILATFVRELELINAQGQVLRCSAVRCCCSTLPLRPVSTASHCLSPQTERPELFNAARCGLGALGVISTGELIVIEAVVGGCCTSTYAIHVRQSPFSWSLPTSSTPWRCP